MRISCPPVIVAHPAVALYSAELFTAECVAFRADERRQGW